MMRIAEDDDFDKENDDCGSNGDGCDSGNVVYDDE